MILAPNIDMFGEEGMYCAGLYYGLESGINPADCATIKWITAQVPAGGVVDATDVIFTSPNGIDTFVLVPLDGLYCFSFECGIEGPPL